MGANSSFLSACKPRWVLLDIAVTACLANICNAVYNTQCRRRQKPRGICTAGRESGRLLQTKAVNIDSTSRSSVAQELADAKLEDHTHMDCACRVCSP